MIAALLSHSVGFLFAESSSDGSAWLLAGGPAAGGGTYYGFWRFYRNTHRSHGFETETRVAAQPITGTDQKVGNIEGTKKSDVDGANAGDHRARVQRLA